jgi:flagellar hook-associated protein 1 FlgK
VFTNINAIHSTGYGLNDTTAWTVANPGRDFFTVGDTSQFAASISVNSELDDVSNIAAAVDPGVKGDGRLAESIFHYQVDTTTSIYKYNSTTGLVEDTGQNDSMNHYNSNRVADTSLTIKRINTLTSQHGNLVSVMDTQRESATGVSLDEEAANLVKYQRSYQASIRLMTAVDDMLDRVINQMAV